jgi:hypothetical protein
VIAIANRESGAGRITVDDFKESHNRSSVPELKASN